VKVTDAGVPVDTLIDVVKEAVKQANVSRASQTTDLRVDSVQLILNAVTTKSTGGKLDFCIPFIGMKLSAGAKVTAKDTHIIDISLIPPEKPTGREIRDQDIEDVLVKAISTIRAVMARAAGGDDPWVLSTGKVDISFAITKTGSISLGAEGEAGDELTHTLRIGLAPVQ
jgi:Trypsin-co-occurring domain 2